MLNEAKIRNTIFASIFRPRKALIIFTIGGDIIATVGLTSILYNISLPKYYIIQ